MKNKAINKELKKQVAEAVKKASWRLKGNVKVITPQKPKSGLIKDKQAIGGLEEMKKEFLKEWCQSAFKCGCGECDNPPMIKPSLNNAYLIWSWIESHYTKGQSNLPKVEEGEWLDKFNSKFPYESKNNSLKSFIRSEKQKSKEEVLREVEEMIGEMLEYHPRTNDDSKTKAILEAKSKADTINIRQKLQSLNKEDR